MEKKRMPIGIEFFEDIRRGNWYYVDKTHMIKELIDNQGKVNLFTRPRRFGKSLNMDMLKEFFEIGAETELFEGLSISKEKALCDKHMGKYPVIYTSLKDTESATYRGACDMISVDVNEEAVRHRYLLESDKLSQEDKDILREMMRGTKEMSERMLCTWLRTLSRLLYEHHGCRVIILIDEYDVPLAKASTKDYYGEMVSLISRMFAQGLKSNPYLEFAVLTGCLRVSRESIFTGLNNLNVFTISDTRFASCFGFTDEEVKHMLEYYGMEKYHTITKEWYDGYRFGNVSVYCPWDVINWCALLCQTSNRTPQNYWVNSSGNDALKYLIRKTESGLPRMELEVLMKGGTIRKKISEELTYGELYSSIDNVWSLLYVTGYLTLAEEPEDDIYTLLIPNNEVMNIFEEQILNLFMDNVRMDADRLIALCNALRDGNSQNVEKEIGDYLSDLISIRDTAVRKSQKENFYHGIILGILGLRKGWRVYSNNEAGDGYADIVIQTMKDGNVGIVIEVKYAEQGDFAAACKKGMDQIDDLDYVATLRKERVGKIYKYAIACFKKSCKVIVEEENVHYGIEYSGEEALRG